MEKAPRQLGLTLAVVFIVVAFVGGLGVGFVVFQPAPTRPTIVWSSTQLAPAAETQFVVQQLLPPFEEENDVWVRFVPEESYATFEDRMLTEQQTGNVRVTVAGGLYGDFSLLTSEGFLTDLSGMSLPDRTFIQGLEDLTIQPDGTQPFVPWMQATYLMVINNDALPYLPSGADVEALTYDDVTAWAQNIAAQTAMDTPIGLPAGPGGLIHRLVHGYLYPSYTGATVGEFDSPEAVTMWQDMKAMWPLVHPSSPLWTEMSPHLLDDSVWIAWDHLARFKTAVQTRPNDFIVVPSPAGPEGRGYIAVAAGLGIPQGAPHAELGQALIEYLTRPAVQAMVTEGSGFFPVVEEAQVELPSGPIATISDGVTKQSGSPDAIIATIPGGLGGRSGEFSDAYRDAFNRILIAGEAIATVLAEIDADLQALFSETGAPLPLPG